MERVSITAYAEEFYIQMGTAEDKQMARRCFPSVFNKCQYFPILGGARQRECHIHTATQ